MQPVELFPARHAAAAPVNDPTFDCCFASWQQSELKLAEGRTHFGFVGSGEATIDCRAGKFSLQSGMYFSVPGSLAVRGTGAGFIATRVGWQGFFQVGGPVENQGRLTYIDGCSDSLLISPVVLGDPCLNLLYLPPHTVQTQHTHPSCRLGMIISGEGVCQIPGKSHALSPGMLFKIAADALHSFHTENQSLRVIAWHPDSDFGPAHQDHPMINRTIINGISAKSRLQPE